MEMKWLHIDTDVGDNWILPIWSAVNKAIESNLVPTLTEDMRELGLHISTRLDILPFVVSRLNSEVEQIYKSVSNYGEEFIFTKNKDDAYAFPMSEKREIVLYLLADIDALLFETNSVCELMTKFFESLYSHAGINLEKSKVGLKIRDIIESEGHDSKWFQNLDSHRNFFIHEGAPYLAIDVSFGPNKYDLLIMKENLNIFEDSSKFFRLSELNNIVQGFVLARHTIQKHLIDIFHRLSS
jgi:hypothetical protein